MQKSVQHRKDIDLIASLSARIDTVLSPALTNLSSFALVDFPDHDNVGDSAIWLGEVAYLTGRGVKPSYVCTLADYSADDLRRLVPKGPILIHGGGNFGDIWPRHQQFREAILAQFPDREVIQLPQTLHYGSEAGISQTAAIIEKHGNFTLFVRDQRSYDIAKAFPCRVVLCPDMALCLGPLDRPSQPQHDLFCLMRTDKERSEAIASAAAEFPRDAVIRDWVGQRRRERTLYKMTSVSLNPFLSPAERKYQSLNSLAGRQLKRGVQLLSSGRYVMTDRLHAHLISLLLRIPHIVLDNSYGKVSGFIEQWTHESELFQIASDLPSALAIYRALKQENGLKHATDAA
ncbi:MAG: polysaccharide pyruvyl transferase family protein [Dongiaceae bacterium]